ncbi:DNAse I-like superfamily protein [Striga hermonthica]|uniref:DNAse I-like superfamily protein n=1 Tax=Striga hermonthica TaxID=68872 RepID=A0A9N7MPJ7_STRHE|nr:DNAse I-like superfamily protein [Striga hermonthica]
MRDDGNSKKSKSKDGDFCADGNVYEGSDKECNNNHACNNIKKSKKEKLRHRIHDRETRNNPKLDSSQTTEVQNYRIFVATWNVGGKSPPSHLNLEEWLHTSPLADVYVLGFQEIVPLNAGNVLGAEDNGPARKWHALVRKTLNTTFSKDEFTGPVGYYSYPCCHSSHSTSRMMDSRGICDQTIFGSGDYGYNYCSSGEEEEEDNFAGSDCNLPPPISFGHSFSAGQSSYCLVTSKQMVGLFLMVWIRSDLSENVRDLSVSCVGRGLMGYLGNKGAISISMCLEKTSFCFVCSHLTSGEKEGDELRRNSDVMEILKKTRFPQVHDKGSPCTILDHEYLRIEQRHGRVFAGWSEGRIYFPPTYKYSNNSDKYAGENMRPREKRRTPAWCDRILWHGYGLHQLSYVRGESRFSDHRPVYSLFLAEVESTGLNCSKKSPSYSSSRV